MDTDSTRSARNKLRRSGALSRKGVNSRLAVHTWDVDVTPTTEKPTLTDANPDTSSAESETDITTDEFKSENVSCKPHLISLRHKSTADSTTQNQESHHNVESVLGVQDKNRFRNQSIVDDSIYDEQTRVSVTGSMTTSPDSSMSCGDSQRDVERDIERDSERDSGVVTSPWSTVSDMSGSSMTDSLHEDRLSSNAWARCESIEDLPAALQREETVPEGEAPCVVELCSYSRSGDVEVFRSDSPALQEVAAITAKSRLLKFTERRTRRENSDSEMKPYLHTHLKSGPVPVYSFDVRDVDSEKRKSGRKWLQPEPHDAGPFRDSAGLYTEALHGITNIEEEPTHDQDIYENVCFPPSIWNNRKGCAHAGSVSSKSSSTYSSASGSSTLSYPRRGDGPYSEPDTSAPSLPDTDSDGDSEFEGWADSDFEDGVGSQSENEDERHYSDDILYNIVLELTKTEESYLKKIDILIQVYNKAMKILKKENVRAMFPNIESLYHLHKEMLQAFKTRLVTWETNRAIGDVMNQFAPHLKMYKEYVAHFQTSEEAVTECMRASTVFAAAVQKITEGGKLGITAYMLEPIQRVPRYELLMKEFLKKLPADDDEERASVQKAIAAIHSATSGFQDAIRDKDIFGGLVKIQKVLDRNVVSPGRELVKKGTLTSVDRHRRLKRTVFLFNDELFVCREDNMRRLGGGMGYITQYQLPLKHMQVTEDESVEEPFLMLVRTRSHVIHFAFPSAEERLPWLQAFWQLLTEQPSSLRQETALDLMDEATPAQEKLSLLGRVAPVWVWDSEASMCMLCADDFAAFKRKHHCRACGCLVCHKCSSRTLALEYAEGSKRCRVCDECHQVLSGPANLICKKRFMARERQLRCCLYSGYLRRNDAKVKGTYWTELHEGGMLFSYRARLDIMPYSSEDLAGYTFEVENRANKIVFLLRWGSEQLLFEVKQCETLLGWLDAFEKAVKLGSPDNFLVDSDQRRVIEVLSQSMRQRKAAAASAQESAQETTETADIQSHDDDCTGSEEDKRVPRASPHEYTEILQGLDTRLHIKPVTRPKPKIPPKSKTLQCNSTPTTPTTDSSDVRHSSHTRALDSSSCDVINDVMQRSKACQVNEIERPSRKCVQALVSRFTVNENTSDKTTAPSKHSVATTSVSLQTAESVPLTPKTGRQASMYSPEVCSHVGVQTCEELLVHLESSNVPDSEC